MKKKLMTMILAAGAMLGAYARTYTAADFGKVVCADGSVYATAADASSAGKTARAMIACVDGNYVLAIALADTSTTGLLWNEAVESAVTWTADKAVAGGQWRLPSADDYKRIFAACGGSAYTTSLTEHMEFSWGDIQTMLSSAGGTQFDSLNTYWLSDEASEGTAWGYRTNLQKFRSYSKSNFWCLARPVLAFGTARTYKKVQLWENGPYWAETNIGADEAWDSGYHFWWGDTVGYYRENNKWVASDGSNSDFSFSEANTPTYGKDTATLLSEGWITADGVLAPEHDAAHVQWGENWRMPTYQEMYALTTKCDREWVTTNGVKGYVFRGKGDYSANSIFLPVTGIGTTTSFSDANTEGYYWSSDHQSGPYHSVQIWFGSSFFDSDDYYCYRLHGQAVRPVWCQTVKVTFNLNYDGGGTTNKAIGVGRPVLSNAPEVTREGWTFVGWSATPDGSTIGSDVVAAESATYYAIWARVMHAVSGLPTANATVTVDGVATNVPASGTISVAEGATVKVAPAAGYRFESFITSYSEGFEGGVMPAGWSQEDDGSGVDWVAWESSPHTGSYCIHRNYLFSIYSGYRRKLITPFFNLSNQSSAMLGFWIWNKSEAFAVYYRTSATDEWHTLHEFGVASHTSWVEENLTLPNLSSTYQIAFEFIDNYGSGMSIDDVTIAAEGAVDDADGSYSFTVPASDVVVTQVLGVVPEITATIAAINAIGEVAYTAECKAKIDAARAAYDALTDAQKALVANAATLTAAETTYTTLKTAAEAAAAADAAAAATVAGAINAIGEVAYTDESKAKIDAARAAYDALTDAQKALVANAAALTAAETAYEALKPAPVVPPAPCYVVLDEADVKEPYAAAKAVTLAGAAYDGCDVVGVVELKLGKVSKGKSKVSGSVTTLDGKKHSAKGVTVTGIDGAAPVTVSLEVKDFGTMAVTIGGTQFAGSLGGKYHVQSADVGGALADGPVVAAVEPGDLSAFSGTVLAEFLPTNEVGAVSGGKWNFAKPASVKWAKPKGASEKELIVDTSKGKNLSGLKLTYTLKKGTFKGSFNVYALEGSGSATKLKKYKLNVNGVVVGGIGYGVATSKKPSIAWPMTVEACNTCTR